jgi:hypothetical protein
MIRCHQAAANTSRGASEGARVELSEQQMAEACLYFSQGDCECTDVASSISEPQSEGCRMIETVKVKKA